MFWWKDHRGSPCPAGGHLSLGLPYITASWLSSASQKAVEEPDTELGGRKKTEEPGDSYHVNARHLLYPNCPITRFPVPNEKVPWEVSACLSPTRQSGRAPGEARAALSPSIWC